jgi:glycosyltransferase involved in cell wall biosynthesis
MEIGRALWRSITAPHSGLGVAVSRAIADEAQRDVAPLPIVEIPNGVEVESVRWIGDQNVVYVAGGTGVRKSEETAIRAWARLGTQADSATLVVGGVEPTHRRAELQRLVRGLGLERAVEVQGALPRRAYLERMARARVTVSCSRLESFGLPVAEALVMGAPVLCSDLPAHRELIARAGAGSAFPAGDDLALAARLREALKGDLPGQLSSPPLGWDWNARGREHVDAYQTYLHA